MVTVSFSLMIGNDPCCQQCLNAVFHIQKNGLPISSLPWSPRFGPILDFLAFERFVGIHESKQFALWRPDLFLWRRDFEFFRQGDRLLPKHGTDSPKRLFSLTDQAFEFEHKLLHALTSGHPFFLRRDHFEPILMIMTFTFSCFFKDFASKIQVYLRIYYDFKELRLRTSRAFDFFLPWFEFFLFVLKTKKIFVN